MAVELSDDNQKPAALHEKDDAEHDEKADEAGGTNTPSTDGLTAKEREALTRRVLLKLDFRWVSVNSPEELS